MTGCLEGNTVLRSNDMYEWPAEPISNATTASTATATLAPFDFRLMRRDLTHDEVGRRLREANWFAASLPCIVCGTGLLNVFEAENQPSGGVAFASSGHYAPVFDPDWSMTGARKHIEINICDACFTVAVERSRVLLLEASHHRSAIAVSLYRDALSGILAAPPTSVVSMVASGPPVSSSTRQR